MAHLQSVHMMTYLARLSRSARVWTVMMMADSSLRREFHDLLWEAEYLRLTKKLTSIT